MSPLASIAVMVVTGVVAFALSLLVRRRFSAVEPGPWSSTLSYVAAAYGVIVGFSIVFLFGTFSDARQAVGDEATSIGTAFEEARLFPEDAENIQHALICYSRAVPEFEWPAMSGRDSAPEVDDAFRDIILSLDGDDEPTDGTFQPATATNLVVQVGNISTARETRLVAAETRIPPLFWGLLLGSGLLVVGLIFVVSLSAHPRAQATLVGFSAVFTAVMLLIVLALSTPFSQGGGRVKPELIEQTTTLMESEAPNAAFPCTFEMGS